MVLGYKNSLIGSLGACLGTPLGWAWQDFSNVVSTDITITGNENGTGFTFDPARVVSGTAVIVKESDVDAFLYSGTVPLFSTKVSVTSHTGVDVDINTIPHASWGDARVYYLYNFGCLPQDYTLAPKFLRDTNFVEIDNLFITEEEFAAFFPINHDNASHITNTGVNTHTQIDSHISNTNNPHQVTAEQVGSPSDYSEVDSFDVTSDGQVNFTLSNTPDTPAETSQMTINGLKQTYGDHYTISSNIATFNPTNAGFQLELNNEFGQPDRVIVSYMT